MHIITGMLLAGLLGRRRGDGREEAVSGLDSPLLRAPSVLSVAHALPGRTRFRVPALVGRHEAAARLHDALAGINGIHAVSVSAVSGSVVIDHDAQRVRPDVLAAALVRLLGLEAELTREVESTLGRELRDLSRAANRAVYERTGGLLDVKTVLFLGLAGLGLGKVLQQRSLALPAGFTLLWWAANGLLRGRQTAS